MADSSVVTGQFWAVLTASVSVTLQDLEVLSGCFGGVVIKILMLALSSVGAMPFCLHFALIRDAQDYSEEKYVTLSYEVEENF